MKKSWEIREKNKENQMRMKEKKIKLRYLYKIKDKYENEEKISKYKKERGIKGETKYIKKPKKEE